MATSKTRAVVAGVSALAGVIGGVATNIVTSDWRWTWGLALLATTVLMVVSQIWLSFSEGRRNVSATGTGAVAADGSIRGQIEIDAADSNSQAPTPNPAQGVHAAGTGSIAAGRGIRGPIRIRARRQ